MRNRSHLIAWTISALLVVTGVALLFLAPQPFITYNCGVELCSSQVSGGFSVGIPVIVLGVVATIVAGIMTLVRRGAQHA